jgi:hypothetical protein
MVGFGGRTPAAEAFHMVEGVFGAMGLFVTNLPSQGRSTGGY